MSSWHCASNLVPRAAFWPRRDTSANLRRTPFSPIFSPVFVGRSCPRPVGIHLADKCYPRGRRAALPARISSFPILISPPSLAFAAIARSAPFLPCARSWALHCCYSVPVSYRAESKDGRLTLPSRLQPSTGCALSTDGNESHDWHPSFAGPPAVHPLVVAATQLLVSLFALVAAGRPVDRFASATLALARGNFLSRRPDATRCRDTA